MGVIHKVISSFDDSSELADAQKEIVSALSDLAETKAEYYEEAIARDLLEAGTAGNRTIPITQIIDTDKQTHAYSSSKSDIGTTVTKAIGDFVRGGKDNIVGGICNLLTEAISIFLGEASAEENTMQETYILTEGLSIVRFDVYGWYRSVRAKSLKTQAEKVSAFVLFKSSIDVQKLEYNTFLDIYGRQVSMHSNASPEELEDELRAMAKLFEVFKGEVREVAKVE